MSTNGNSVSFEGEKNVLKLIVVMVAELCGHSENC